MDRSQDFETTNLGTNVISDMAISDEDVQKIKDATDIVSVVSQYVTLKKAGMRWAGLCPFHTEKTGSFSVNAEEGFFYCFGCQKTGDVIQFVREIEQLDFVESVEWLAEKAGIVIEYTNVNDASVHREKKLVSELLTRSAQFFNDRLLSSPDAGKARAYLRNRGFTRETVEAFQIGYAPMQTGARRAFLGTDATKMEAAGLGYPGGGSFFRDRLMFPISEPNGQVIGFGGRMLPEGQPPKYKNSPQSKVYDKSKVLYGLNFAKKEIVASGQIIVCEGYTDVIGCAKAGVPRAVATCGTALTEQHMKLMTRFAKKIVLAFDADGAGQAAADRFYAWEKSYEVEVFVAQLPSGSDPGQMAEENPEALVEAIKSARPFLEHRIGRVLQSIDLTTAEGRARASDMAAQIISEHPNDLVRDQYVVELADKLKVSIEILRKLVLKYFQDGQKRGDVTKDVEAHNYEEGGSKEFGPISSAERNLLCAVIHAPEAVKQLTIKEMFNSELASVAFDLLCKEDWKKHLDAENEQLVALIQRLSVERIEADPIELLSRVLDPIIDRWQMELVYDVTDIERLRINEPLVKWLSERQEEMHLEETRLTAVQAITSWLRSVS